ncbi:hypothetical protein ACHAXA_011464 [Cyclostephanos tholiformis]|uniref:Peptide-methionine (S)-S-oxide reductase n=1 Tax=Cyclostephanos tholiformis TaxID=382380 RepID=A0ABD3SE64_9STRA
MSRRIAISFSPLLSLLSPWSSSHAWTGTVSPSRVDPPRAGTRHTSSSPVDAGAPDGPAERREDDVNPHLGRHPSRRSFPGSSGDVGVDRDGHGRFRSPPPDVSPPAAAAIAAEIDDVGDDIVDVYFGCGCFWHVQHEFVEAERRILGRTDPELTSGAGYAGGGGGEGCWDTPRSSRCACRRRNSRNSPVEYCKLFDDLGNRPDQFGDRGPEYRNLVGIPGGTSSPLAAKLVRASISTGDRLDFAVGKGDDGDVPAVSYVMDTADFPFFVAERYHQFHDGFRLDEGYPESYNSLAGKFASKGENFGTCPNGMMGIGFGGL